MCGVHGTLNSIEGHDLLNIPSIADILDIIAIIDSWQVLYLWLPLIVLNHVMVEHTTSNSNDGRTGVDEVGIVGLNLSSTREAIMIGCAATRLTAWDFLQKQLAAGAVVEICAEFANAAPADALLVLGVPVALVVASAVDAESRSGDNDGMLFDRVT